MDKLRTRVVIGIAAVGMSVGSPFSAGIAQANDHTFLDSLRAASLHPQGRRTIRDSGRSPGVPGSTQRRPARRGGQFLPLGPWRGTRSCPQVYLDIVQSELCPNALNPAPPPPA